LFNVTNGAPTEFSSVYSWSSLGFLNVFIADIIFTLIMMHV